VQKNNTVARSKKTDRGSTAEILPWRRSDGPKRLIAVEASCLCTNYTFRLHQICIHPKLPLVTHRGPHDVSGWDQLVVTDAPHMLSYRKHDEHVRRLGSGGHDGRPWIHPPSFRYVYGLDRCRPFDGQYVPSHRIDWLFICSFSDNTTWTEGVSNEAYAAICEQTLLELFSFVRFDTNLRPNCMSPI
jgi:hypothetical protein